MYSSISGRNDSVNFASSTLSPTSPRTAHEEATVEGVMNRWRVRPIYDNYSATVAPSAPDTMSIFLSLRAELLKSSLNLEQAAQQQNDQHGGGGNSSSSSDSESESEEGDGIAAGSVLLDDRDPLSSYLSAKAAAKKKKKDKRKQRKKDDYTARHLKGELARLLEQLQVSNAETIQLKNQIAGMTKELSVRQRKITDLEETNRSLVDQNQQLQQTVAELGLTLSAVEENNHQQMNMASSATFGSARQRAQSMASFPNRTHSTMEDRNLDRHRSVHFNN